MKTKQIVKELALLVGAALGIFLVLVLIAWVRSLTGGTLGGSLWRLSAFAGAVIWQRYFYSADAWDGST